MRTSPPIDPPVRVTLSVPPPTLTKPPIWPPLMMIVSSPSVAETLLSTEPPDMTKRLSAACRVTLPILPPVNVALSPASNVPMMWPPDMKNVSRSPPC